jgi:hypothetical protein
MNNIDRMKERADLEKKKIFIKKVFYASISLIIMLFMWLSFEGYHRSLGTDEVEASEHLIKRINPNLQLEIFEAIQNLRLYSIEEVNEQFKSAFPETTEPALDDNVQLPEGLQELPLSTESSEFILPEPTEVLAEPAGPTEEGENEQ